MKNRKFIFKFVDHDNKTIRKFDLNISSPKIEEWIEQGNDSDIEEYVKWMAEHARREKLIKDEIKSIIKNKLSLSNKTNFDDYRIVKDSFSKKSEAFNTELDAKNPPHFIETKMISKNMLKLEKGTKPSNWLDIFNYSKTEEHYHYALTDDMTDRINLRVLNQTGDKIVIPQNNNTNTLSKNILNVRNTNASNVNASNPNVSNPNVSNPNTARQMGINMNTATTNNRNLLASQITNATARPGYYTGDNVNFNPSLNVAPAQQALQPSQIVQAGGDNNDYQDKYIKYKKKYTDLKSKRSSN